MKEKKFFNRDISWLSFNERILQEAEDESVPLAERIKFLGIFQSNLEVFVKERFLPLITISHETEEEIEKERHEKLVEKLHRKLTKQVKQCNRTLLKDIFPTLAEKGVQVVTVKDFTEEQISFSKKFFAEKIKEHLTPFFITEGTKDILLENSSGYLLVELKFHDEEGLAMIELPSEIVGRFIATESPQQFVFADDIIRLNLEEIFPGHTIEGCYALQQISGSEFMAADELKDSLHELKKTKKKRSMGEFSFLLYQKDIPERLLEKLRTLIGTYEEACIETGAYSNLKELMQFPKLDIAELYYPPAKNLPLKIPKDISVFEEIKKKDLLLCFPYDSYQNVLNLLQQAATDSSVTEVAITLYRVAKESKVIEALISAAKNGKAVTVFQEVKATDNEAANILWARAMEEAGVKVIRNFPGYKVHAKLLLITLRQAQGDPTAAKMGQSEPVEDLYRIAYLSSGNFNEKTSASYIDMSLVTADQEITLEVKTIFDSLQEKNFDSKNFNRLLVSPVNLRKQLMDLIDREIEFAQKGEPAKIILKLNNLEDKEIISKLYDAGEAGVEVQMIIRGICCLVPPKKKSAEKIAAISIVDRYLEHARVFVFHNGGNPVVYLSSADLMARNLNKRIEVAFPVTDNSLKEKVLNFLAVQWSDNVKARVLDKKQKNKYREPADIPVRSQEAVYHLLSSEKKDLTSVE